MKISIIIPVEGGAEAVYDCVQSVLEQTETCEIILVDNATEDGSHAVIEDCAAQFPEDIRAVYLPQSRGSGGAKNAGLEAATGEYVAFLNVGDRIEPNFASEMYGCAKGADIVCADYDGSGTGFSGWPGRDITGEKEKLVCVEKAGCVEGRLYRRAFLEQTGLRFPENTLFEGQFFNFLSVILADTMEKAPGIYYHRDRAADETPRNDPAAYQRLDISRLILSESKARGVYDEFRALVDHKFIAMSMGNIRFLCLGSFDKPNVAKLEQIRRDVLENCPNYEGNPYYGNTLWKLRHYFELTMKDPAKAVKAFKNDSWVELRAALKDKMGMK